MVNCQLLIVMPGTWYPTAEEHPPLPPPFKGGKSEAKGGCYPFKGGECGSEALGKQATPQRRAESLNEYGFRCRLCHSEHSEESRPGKGKRFFASL
ncbi:hypothetical protein BGK60_01935 [Tannerella forsythia]|nr:hypothetical protein BGK60_01935 [Tannerella forsythia]